MRNLHIIVLIIFFGCTGKSPSVLKGNQTNSFWDSLRKETRSATIFLFVNFSTSKSSIVAQEFKNKGSLDTLFSYLGKEVLDTSCNATAHQNPIGEIYLYKDMTRTTELADLYFMLNDDCNQVLTSIEKNSGKFHFTTNGKKAFYKLNDRFKAPQFQ